MTDDLDRIMAVMAKAFDPQFGESWTRRQVEDALLLPQTSYLLAGPAGQDPQPGDGACGFALVRTILDEAELLLLAVDPASRGQGVGSELLNRVIKSAQSDGCTRLFLEMRDGNRAEVLYRRAGFEQVGRRNNYYRRGTGPAVDAITFARGLPAQI
jgi:ribosomal-protein-alanine N-acetyltransferase